MSEQPRISPYIAKLLLSKTPAHAYAAHRLLGGSRKDKPSKAMKLGTATDLAVQKAVEGYKPDRHDTSPKTQMAKAVIDSLREHGIKRDFCKLQRRLEWEADGPVLCSSVPDIVVPDWKEVIYCGLIIDIKTGRDLSGPAIVRQCERLGYDVQIAAYAEGYSALNGNGKPKCVFLYVENTRPYRTRWINVSSKSLGVGTILWRQACTIWKDCLDRGIWPAWPDLELQPSQYRTSAAQTSWLDGD